MSRGESTGNWAEGDVGHMQAALELAREAASGEEVPVGAVVIAGQAVVGRGRNRTIADRDPTAHAEIVALRAAAREIGNHRLAQATLFVTLEPCVMCVGAMIQARIERLVFGAYDEKAGAAGSVFDLSGERNLNHRIEVNGGLLADECGRVLSDFFERRRG